MSVVQPRLPAGPVHQLPTYEEPSVARFLVVPGSDGGFLTPSDAHPLGEVHLRDLHAPGLVRSLPAVLMFRTEFRAGSRFHVRINRSIEFTMQADGHRAQSWHEVIAPGVLREEDNEITLWVAPDNEGQVIFSEITILYTSNKLTITRPIVLEPLG